MGIDYDLVVVGGGPAGCAVARDVAGAGFKVLIAEEHARVGEPLQCSGLISARTLYFPGFARSSTAPAARGMGARSG